LIHTAALNLGLLMRLMVGVGTPRSLQGRLRQLLAGFFALVHWLIGAKSRFWSHASSRWILSMRHLPACVPQRIDHQNSLSPRAAKGVRRCGLVVDAAANIRS
jgi:hypothetical protein